MKDETTRLLIEFLRSGERTRTIAGLGELSADSAGKILQERIPAEIQVRGVCTRGVHGVVAAPHAGFDHWSEYYCNRLAPALQLGWVVALNYRDQDSLRIPVAIGRHHHVNRPTESDGPGAKERRTERAEQVFADYVRALRTAGGTPEPLDLLIELHSHKRSSVIEIATIGVDERSATAMMENYADAGRGHDYPELRIEPLHTLRLSATAAKSCGVFRGEYVRYGLHIEIPRGLRSTEERRQEGVQLLTELLKRFIQRIESAA